MLKDCPAHIEPLLTEIVGVGFTVTLLIAGLALTQPAEFVPQTEYDVLAVGETVAVPLENVYVLAPLGNIVKDFPLQIAPLFTDTIGSEYGVTVITY